MTFVSAHRSKSPGPDGRFVYDPVERAVWAELARTQAEGLSNRAAPAFLRGVRALGLSPDEVPQVHDVSAKLRRATGFRAEPVRAMIDAETFFGLLRRRRFPVATFLRRPDEIAYLKEPDLFHEIYGHCPLLTDPDYARLVARFGELAHRCGPRSWDALQRLFWFTVEFGLLRTPEGLRLFGAGLLSSPRESRVALLPTGPHVHRPFTLDAVLATDYRIDVLQPIYFVLDDLAQLDAALNVFERRCAPAPPRGRPEEKTAGVC